MEERTPNRLIHEKSPYLLQHAHNPVDWYPWGEEAFAKAKAENKPIFLSIGYATCHWCHVMERESFEDEDVAALMRTIVVAVKVDREERPDLDTLYMSFCQAMTGQGGWPLTIVLTPEGHPFFAATYLPKESLYGRVGLKDLLQRLYVAWSRQHAEVVDSAARVLETVRAQLEARVDAGDLTDDTLNAARQELAQDFDAEHGGFGGAPKFPAPHNLLFLLREWRRTKDAESLSMVETTLLAMRAGGIFDQLGLGFHRYATDNRWFLPHFEKMLYDQAMLAMAYTEGYLATGNPVLRQTALDIFDYVQRDLTSPEGLFYSAEDADSEGVEGKFYVWTADEVRAALPAEEAALFLAASGFEDGGNVIEEATGQATGTNLPYLPVPLDRFAAEKGLPLAEVEERLARCRETLRAIREKRVRPLRDDKVLTDWNGLMLAALAKAARAFDDADLADRAVTAAKALLSAMRGPDGRLLHRLRQGEAGVPGMLDDYAFLAWGFLELAQAVPDPSYLATAVELTDILLARFAAEGGGFFLTADDAEALLVRQTVFLDAALPCGNSVAYFVLTTLMRLTGRRDYGAAALALSRAAAATASNRPSALTFLLGGLSQLLTPAAEATIAGNPEAPDTRALLAAVNSRYLPELALVLRPDEPEPAIAAIVPSAAPRVTRDGKATAYLCRGGTCQAPVTTPGELVQLVEG